MVRPFPAMARGVLEDGIDRAWLDEVARADPITHAFACWDVDHAADRVRFVTLRVDGVPTAYLLLWYGLPELPIVHWVGEASIGSPLLGALPPRPLIIVAPDGVADEVARTRGPVDRYPLLVLARGSPRPFPRGPSGFVVRRLRAHDVPSVLRLAQEQDALIVSAYRSIDPEVDRVYGAFLEGRLVGVARVQVALPRVWLVGGVYTVPGARNRGVGTALTTAAVREAEAAGAQCALVVREDNGPARRVYDRLGFGPVGRRTYLDAGSGRRP